MNSIEWLLLGYVLGVLPGVRAARVATAAVGKLVGVKPRQVEEYDEATTEDGEQ